MLPAGALLNDQYLIGRAIGHGGFGITYLAWGRNLKLAIKEDLPGDLATRGPDGATLVSYSGEKGECLHYGLDRFLEEAQILNRFQQHPGRGARPPLGLRSEKPLVFPEK